MRLSKEIVLASLAISLTLLSLALTPSVDKVVLKESWQYPFFYAKTLPIIYYVAIVYSALLSLLSNDDHCKLISLLCVAFLVELTPSLMLANPWLLDQFPYLAEPVYLIETSHVSRMHYLQDMPGLALMFSQFMLVTGLGPFAISKLYPLFTVLMLVLPTYLLSKKLCGDGSLIPLLFLSINTAQINTFHRFSYFFMLFCLLFYLVWARATRPAIGYSVFSVLAYSTAVLSYPGSIIISILVLVPALAVSTARLLKVGSVKSSKALMQSFPNNLHLTGLTFLCIFLSWNVFSGSWEFDRIVGNVYQALSELFTVSPGALLTPRHPWAEALTPLFNSILRVRTLLMAMVLALGLLGSVYALFSKRDEAFVPMTYLSSLAILAPFMFTGWNQWYAFKFVVYVLLLASASIATLWRSKRNKYLLAFIALIIVIGAVLIPILRYASIPYLHPTTQELKATSFVDLLYEGGKPICYTDYPPYIRVLLGKDPSWELSGMEPEGLFEGKAREDVGYLLSHRTLTRDGYYVYPLSRQELLNNLISSLSRSHDIVYCNDPYIKLFVPVAW